MAPRSKKLPKTEEQLAREARKRAADRPFAPLPSSAAATAAPTWSYGEPGPDLPPPDAWPRDLKRVVVGMITRDGRTWEDWLRTFKPREGPRTEPMWLALRTLAWKLTQSTRLITNDMAWNTCMAAAHRLAEQERAQRDPTPTGDVAA
jgi:hypothetical protein